MYISNCLTQFFRSVKIMFKSLKTVIQILQSEGYLNVKKTKKKKNWISTAQNLSGCS